MNGAQVGPDEVIIELLQQLVEQGRGQRAEGVLNPKPAMPEEMPPMEGGEEAEMAELEQLLAQSPAPMKKLEDEDETE